MTDPEIHRRDAVVEKGKPVLYGKLKRALYGMLQSALMFW